jgi:hypothetical protein
MDRIMEQLLVCGNLCVARQIKKCNLLFYSYRFVDNQLRKKKKKKKKPRYSFSHHHLYRFSSLQENHIFLIYNKFKLTPSLKRKG